MLNLKSSIVIEYHNGSKTIISTFGDYLRLHGEQKQLVCYCLEHDFEEVEGNGYIVRKAHSFELV